MTANEGSGLRVIPHPKALSFTIPVHYAASPKAGVECNRRGAGAVAACAGSMKMRTRVCFGCSGHPHQHRNFDPLPEVCTSTAEAIGAHFLSREQDGRVCSGAGRDLGDTSGRGAAISSRESLVDSVLSVIDVTTVILACDLLVLDL